MELNDYQNEAKRTPSGRRFPGDSDQLMCDLLGLVGEAGEVADYMKKALYHKAPLDRAKLGAELGDVLWHLAAIATEMGLSLERVAELNLEKLRVRYPNGFTPKDSAERRDVEEKGPPLHLFGVREDKKGLGYLAAASLDEAEALLLEDTQARRYEIHPIPDDEVVTFLIDEKGKPMTAAIDATRSASDVRVHSASALQWALRGPGWLLRVAPRGISGGNVSETPREISVRLHNELDSVLSELNEDDWTFGLIVAHHATYNEHMVFAPDPNAGTDPQVQLRALLRNPIKLLALEMAGPGPHGLGNSDMATFDEFRAAADRLVEDYRLYLAANPDRDPAKARDINTPGAALHLYTVTNNHGVDYMIASSLNEASQKVRASGFMHAAIQQIPDEEELSFYVDSKLDPQLRRVGPPRQIDAEVRTVPALQWALRGAGWLIADPKETR